MTGVKKAFGWLFASLLWLWTTAPRLADWIGRTTLPDDWKQLVDERLPVWASWLFSTPWYVPAILATALTLWLMWLSLPRSAVIEHRQSSPIVTLGRKCNHLNEQLFNIVGARRTPRNVATIERLSAPYFGEMGALFESLEQIGVQAPDPSPDMPTIERIDLAFRYLAAVGPLLRDGHLKAAKEEARSFLSKRPNPIEDHEPL